jgi:hypothetical protein
MQDILSNRVQNVLQTQTPHIALQQSHLPNSPSQCWSEGRGFHLRELNKDFVE